MSPHVADAVQIARQRRLAATRARMQRQLAEKQARDRAEAQQQEAQHDLRSHHRERIEAWKSGKKVRGSFRLKSTSALCCSMFCVLKVQRY